ncbi:MAG: 2-hydroxyacyl-CoA dehydratase [Deltaproteobacteria bacterium]|nr:2-hydroxyacyl-CoA dehydratase [Deltaproteobacteria bacterium]MBW1919137.1 2-hydroxyacyl-CoA dehydratase [Deltaproteobacteria bacterium]MBW1977841.1 2-hydroxyacyl-CoA dehydratase [Deltaproteobacteria bacterium]MBW2044635.1 2-hydroxyacyl-CoA dehydratase [Deltaproteobacteria bacterium]MBW2298983.1 2-hydroxyacyl-CoA dehydratase [Deltaproteobacteria bacterium]
MKELTEKLLSHLATREHEIIQARREGRKVVGYIPGGYLPEEIVIAAGAIPIGLVRGGDHSAVELSSSYICRWFDSFCRAQIGYGISGLDPYYKLLDLLAIPITDNHTRAISDVLDYNTDIEIFPFGVPHMKEESAFRYYLHGVNKFKEKAEEITGTRISYSKLREAILLCNKERELIKKISMLRTSDPPPLSGKDFVALNHGSFVADKAFMIGLLESVVTKIEEDPLRIQKRPRILLTGSTLAMGDSTVVNLIEEAGGNIVIEEFAEGIRPYWENVSTGSDLLALLAEAYFMKRVPPAWFRPGRERLDFLIELVKRFKVDGVIWYQLMFRESYKTESYYFPKRLKEEASVPMLVLESDYDPSEAGPMQTRIETFIYNLGK